VRYDLETVFSTFYYHKLSKIQPILHSKSFSCLANKRLRRNSRVLFLIGKNINIYILSQVVKRIAVANVGFYAALLYRQRLLITDDN
jgi:hypothetical protein